MSGVDTARKPMTEADRDATRAEWRKAANWLNRHYAEHGHPWDELKAGQAADTGDDAA